MSSVLVARFEKRSGLAPVLRAALAVDTVYVALAEAPPAGRNTLQLFLGDELVAAVVAELVGSGRDGEYPLRVRLLDPGHAVELRRLLASGAAPPAAGPPSGSMPAAGPRPSRKSIREPAPDARDLEEDTLASRAEDRTLASRAPLRAPSSPAPKPPAVVTEEPEPVAPSETEIVATTVFDPDSMMRTKHLQTGSEDLTIPRTPGTGPESVPRAEGPSPFFNDDESQTLPGSSRNPGVATAVSWNVRIAPTTVDPLCGRTIGGGKYVLDSVIGSGAIGIVFKASHKDLGRTVAIKVLNPRYRDDADLLAVFRTEARAASQLEHPNVARVYDYGQEPDGLVYIVMEYLSGYTLGSVLDARRRIPAARAVDVMVQVCAALSAAHDREIVHRDVKPDNIVLVPAQDDEGRPVEIVKVCDFGIAALGAARLEEGAAAGTPEYMAPEQTTGSAVNPSADVYACGIVLFEMLTGEVPFKADQAYRILMKHRSEAPRRPSSLVAGVPPMLEEVVMRCMEKLPANRYQSARELRVELRKIAGGESPKA